MKEEGKEPSKWLPFGHDKSEFKKQTSFGDRWKTLAKYLWGDKQIKKKKHLLVLKMKKVSN